MKFPHFNRRLHLYLGLVLLPWFFAYGISSVPISHPEMGQKIYGAPVWKLRVERPFELAVPPDGDLKAIGAALAREVGVDGTVGAWRPNPNRITAYVHTFWSVTQISYDVPKKLLRAEDRAFRWDHFLTGLHARGGYQHESFLSDAWAVLIDVVCLAFFVWVASGLYMWWHLPRHRGWGWLALSGGLLSFGAFLLVL